MQTHSYFSFCFWLLFFRTTRSHLLGRWSHLSLLSCVLRLGSQYIRDAWMRQILYQSQIYNMMPWLLVLEMTHFSPQALAPLLAGTSTSCFPLPMDCLHELLLSCLPLTVNCLIPGSCLLKSHPFSCSWVQVVAYCLPCWPGGWPFCPDSWFLPGLVLSIAFQSKHLPGHTDPSQLILPKWSKPFLRNCYGWYTPHQV